MASIITKKAKALNLPIVDADRDEEIELTVQDITKGVPLTHDRCAFARAFNRIFAIKSVYFFKSTLWLQTESNFLRYLLPADIRAEIAQYDAALLAGKDPTMRPGKYTVKAPRGGQTAAAALARSKKRPGRHMPTGSGIKRGVRFTNARLLDMPPSVKTREGVMAFLNKLGTDIAKPKAVGRRKVKVRVAVNAPRRKKEAKSNTRNTLKMPRKAARSKKKPK